MSSIIDDPLSGAPVSLPSVFELTGAQLDSLQAAQRADTPTIQAANGAVTPVLGAATKFRVTALVSDSTGTATPIPMELVERITWDDSNAITQGTITLRMNPFDQSAGENRLDQGDRIRLEAKVGTMAWREVWTMRCYRPQLTASNIQRNFVLVNDLDLLRQSEDNFYYRASGPDVISGGLAKPGGWTGPEVIADVCKRYKVPLTCYSTTDKIGKIRVRRGSPLEVIRNVLLRERRRNNRRLMIRWSQGRLYVVPLAKSPTLLNLGPTLIEAAFQSELPDQFGSAITIHGLQQFVYGQDSGGTPKAKRQKMHLEMENDVSRKLFGYVHRIVFSPDAKTDADLQAEGLAYLRAVMVPHRTLTLTHTGMPWLRRGDAIQLALGDPGLQKQLIWVNTVQHVVTPQNYTMDFSVVFDDPYRDRREEKLIFQLKATAAQAVGNRDTTNPFWYLGTQKDDTPVASTDPGGGYTTVDPGDPIAGASSDNTGGY